MTKIEISLKTLLTVAALIILYNFFTRIENVLVLIVLAYIITAAVEPLVKLFTEKKIPRNLAIFLIYVSITALLTGGTLLLVTQVRHETSDLLKRVPNLLSVDLQHSSFLTQAVGVNTQVLAEAVKNVPRSFLQQGNAVQTLFKGLVGTTEVLASILSVIVMSIYMLIYKDENDIALRGFVPARYRKRFTVIIKKTEIKLGQWVHAQGVLSFIVFILYYITLSALHIQFALILAVIAGFMEVIPLAGPIISGSLAVIITFLISPQLVIYVLIACFVIQEIEAHILVPKIMQKAIGLNPLITIFSLLVGSTLIGVMGAVLSVPIAVTLQILYLEMLKND